MTRIIKAEIIHKQIMMIISSEIFLKAGEMKAGWNVKSAGSLQHTAKSIESKLQSFKKIIEETDFKKENPDQLEGLKLMLKKDYKSLIESTENVFLPEELREIVSAYKNQVENTIKLLNS